MRYFRLLCISVALIFVFPFAFPAFSCKASAKNAETDKNGIFVSPDGNDSNDGTFQNPLKTVKAAKEKLKSLNLNGEKVTVYLREGTYYFDETLCFDSSDAQNVTFKSYNGEKVEFSGAREISGFSEETVNGVKVFTKTLDISDGKRMKSFFKDGETLNITRYPETGYFTVDSVNTDDNLFTEENTPWSLTLGQQSFNAKKEDVKEEFYNLKDVNVRILHYWHDELMNVTAFDKNTGRVSLSRPSSMLIRDIDRYYFENVFEELNKPNEWYLDTTNGKFYYVPCDGEKADTLVLYGASLTKLIEINGADNISFEGIRFCNTDWKITEVKEGDWLAEYNLEFPQAAIGVDGVFTATYADGIHVKNCEFINIGADGVKFTNGVKNSSVENCYFENIAATGVFAGGTNTEDENDINRTSNITIKNNEIYKYGRKFFCAIGIHITFCDTADVSNNEIHDGYYTGISCGWLWGYTYHITKNISIKNNLIYNIGQGWLSDMGGIYMLGTQPGTELSGNVIHNVAADPNEGGYGGWGLYLDEGSSDMTVKNNLVFCCGSNCFHTHYGKNNTVTNNILAFASDGCIRAVSKPEGWVSSNYTGNIILTDGGAPIYNVMNSADSFADGNNVYWDFSNGGKNLSFCVGDLNEKLTLKEAKKKCFIGENTVVDPLFKDAKNFDFELKENSPAFSLGFESWDYSEAGTLKNTTIGLEKEGGKTQYNYDASLYEYHQGKADSAQKTGKIISIITGAVSALSALFILIKRKCGKLSVLQFFALPVMVVCLYFSYHFYCVNRIEAVYFVLSAIFILLSGISVLALSKKKSFKAYIIPTLITAAAFYAILYGIDDGIGLSGKDSMIITACIFSVYTAVLYVISAVKQVSEKK